jgi:GAF domain-containing protein
MSVPIFVDEKIVAVVGFANKEKDYDENDVANIVILMSGVWQAVERKETGEQLHGNGRNIFRRLYQSETACLSWTRTAMWKCSIKLPKS